jgi:predicted nucleic acid-binding protein
LDIIPMATLYLDSSALAKRYLPETWSAAVEDAIAAASVITSVVARPEVSGAVARAVRERTIRGADGELLLLRLAEHWADFVRLEATEEIAERASRLAWEHGLRGFDAVHLASAVRYREELDLPLSFATFDRQLWRAARAAGLEPWPDGFGD